MVTAHLFSFSLQSSAYLPEVIGNVSHTNMPVMQRWPGSAGPLALGRSGDRSLQLAWCVKRENGKAFCGRLTAPVHL